MSASKRKRNVVTVEQKLNAIERIDKGESVSKICSELNVGKSTVNDWRRNRKTLMDFCTQIESEKVLSERRYLRKPSNEMVDDALWLWFLQERRRGTPISGPVLQEKAMILHNKLGGNIEFVASNGWLDRWKKRHGVKFVNICGEKMSADTPSASGFVAKLEKIIQEERLVPDQVYNIDETGLNFKRLPQKTFSVGDSSSASGFKLNKERITVALCSNASGEHKLPLLVIGKSQKPRAFKNINVSSLPVVYRAQKSAWMDSYIFTDWFVNEFIPKVKRFLKERNLPEKAILVLDNAGTHPHELECEDAPGIKLLFLPANVTSLIQPMDQGVIECMKRRYRRKLLSEILGKMDTDSVDLISALKQINIKDVIYMTAESYNEIPSTTLVKSWRKAWPNIEKLVDGTVNGDVIQVADEQQGNCSNAELINDLTKLASTSGDKILDQDVQEWVTGDDDLDNEYLSDEQIVHNVVQEYESEEAEKSDDDTLEEDKISHEEGRNALQTSLAYIEQQEHSTAVDVMLFKKWRDYAFKKTMDKKVQQKITNYCTSRPNNNLL